MSESAIRSAISIVPLILSFVVATIITAAFIKFTGLCVPPMILCSILMAIGAGLLTTLTLSSTDTVAGVGHRIGYQLLYGFGVGLGLQSPLVLAQTTLSPSDVPTATVVLLFMQALGSTVFLSVGQSVFARVLVEGLETLGLPNAQARTVLAAGATEWRAVVPAAIAGKVAYVYGMAICRVFYVAIGMAVCALFAAVAVEGRTTGRKEKSGPSERGREDEAETLVGETLDGGPFLPSE